MLEKGQGRLEIPAANPNAVYDDLWTIKSSLFPKWKANVTFRKTPSSILISVLSKIVITDSILTKDEEMDCFEIINYLIAESPQEVRIKNLLSLDDIEMLSDMGTYTVENEGTYLHLTKK